uniref:protein-serine/threonine phosphatase n=1 Tax=Cyclopterus lumpus TaxID=8103 RepID=A0A8C3A1L6_CYCLU
MSSPVLLNLLRSGCSTLTRHTCTAQVLTHVLLLLPQGNCVYGCVSLSLTAEQIPFGSVTWDSFGIWDNRIEEPVLLPSSIRYGKAIPQAGLSRVGSASVLGLRKQNEDRLRVARIHDNLLYFAVFDGHGGPHAADYCYTFMEKFIRDALEEEDDLEKVLKKAFLDVDKGLHSSSPASFLTAGTTATVAVLRDGVELVVGSAGDSRALLCRKGRAEKLTRDHTPDHRDERHRIRRFGGFVTWNSVGEASVNGRLAMTRSIGDFHLKASGVIAEPDTRRLTALQYGSEDNASILVVPFGAWGKHQSSTAVYSMSRNFSSSGRWA